MHKDTELNRQDQAYDQVLQEQAVRARRYSYAPYSNFAVGAALLTADGSIYTGCNIENASYPLGNCAERTAFFKAVSDGKTHFTAIAIAGGPVLPDRRTLADGGQISDEAPAMDRSEPDDPSVSRKALYSTGESLACCPPCGACRQVMREFCGPEFRILYSDGAGGFRVRTLEELLPESFGPEQIERSETVPGASGTRRRI